MFSKIARVIVDEFLDNLKEWEIEATADYQPDIFTNKGQDIRLSDQDQDDNDNYLNNLVRWANGTPKRVSDRFRNLPYQLRLANEDISLDQDLPESKVLTMSEHAMKVVQSWNDDIFTGEVVRKAVLLDLPVKLELASENVNVVEDGLMILYTTLGTPFVLDVNLRLNPNSESVFSLPYRLTFDQESGDIQYTNVSSSNRFNVLSFEATIQGFFLANVFSTAHRVEVVDLVISERNLLEDFDERVIP